MNSALLHGAASMRSLERRFEAISMNLANSDTPAFKRLLHVEQETLAQATQGSSLESRYPEVSVSRDMTQGTLTISGDPHELALSGSGFFVAEDAGGLKLTRRAHYNVNDQGELLLGDGSKLMGTAGPLSVPPGTSKIQIDKNGDIRADGALMDRLRVVDLDVKLRPSETGGFFRVGQDEELNPSDAEVRQGVRERSNVAAVDELLELMVTNRLYEANARSMTTRDRAAARMIQQLQ